MNNVQSYENDDRRRAAALEACKGIPTEALERGIVAELYKLAAVCALAGVMSQRRDGWVVIPSGWWDEHIGEAKDRLNDICEPGHSARKKVASN